MRGMKVFDRFKSTQIHALSTKDTNGDKGKVLKSKLNNTSVSLAQALSSYGYPCSDLLEPPIEPNLKPINYIESLAEVYRRIESCSESDKSLICMELYSLLKCLNDSKLLRRWLCAARQYAIDVHSKVVLSSWLRFDRREDELSGVSSMDCSGHVLECPRAALVPGYDPNSIYDHCQCCQDCLNQVDNVGNVAENEDFTVRKDGDVCFRIKDEIVRCDRFKIAALSNPFKVMLYGNFAEGRREEIDFSDNEISAEGMREVERYSRTKRVDSSCPKTVLELLRFANRFCCDEMKSACDAHLAALVQELEDALIIIDYGLEENATLLVASCLQVLLRELPNSLYNEEVLRVFISSENRERWTILGKSSFLLYYFLSQVSMDQSSSSITTALLLERLQEYATETWQKALVLHQLGCVMLEMKEYKDAQFCFEAASQLGHVYSLAGVARAKHRQGQEYSAFRIMNSIIFEHKPVGWMYQERSLYCVGREKLMDLNAATELDPTLSFPYKFRAVIKFEEKKVEEAITEINRIIGFRLLPDCLELRAWFYIVLEDYGSALRDIRALLTLEPDYVLLQGKVNGDILVDLLRQQVRQWSLAESWMELYDRWSSVDDVGSLAVIHQMLVNDPGKSLLRFRQSLLLLRLNCQKAAMRCLRLARNQSLFEHEKLVYEGWILYDSGHREEALSKAEKSLAIERSFEAFFLKAYALADTTMDAESSSYVIELLEEALRCPSDGLRKGQALNNLASVYVDCSRLENAENCYKNAVEIQHTRAHQGLARVYQMRNKRKAAFEEMTKLIEKAQNNASAYEKRSEYCDREMAKQDLEMATQLDPLRTYPYRYRAAVLMDDQKESEALEELNKAIAFKPDLQMLHLRAAFHESIGDFVASVRDCEAALALDPGNADTRDLYTRTKGKASHHTNNT